MSICRILQLPYDRMQKLPGMSFEEQTLPITNYIVCRRSSEVSCPSLSSHSCEELQQVSSDRRAKCHA
jgi:hypothetical protein